MIATYPFSSVPAGIAEKLQQQIHKTFGHIPFVQEREWAQPDWCCVLFEGDEVATFCNVVLREVTMDGSVYKVGGINNVITPVKYRGKGLATGVLKATEQFIFDELGCAFGLLLCADALLPFYSRLNWYAVNTTLYYNQPTGRQLYDSNVMLLAPGQQAKVYPAQIDLNGLPW